jgi:hypothetical protein
MTEPLAGLQVHSEIIIFAAMDRAWPARLLDVPWL